MTHTDDARQATAPSDCSAAWRIDDGTVRVGTLRKGRSVIDLGGLELGRCCEAGTPRRLSNQIRYAFKRQRDANRGGVQ
ncbi:hypothetical protein ACWIGW_41180 [Nocardia brasiliensis]